MPSPVFDTFPSDLQDDEQSSSNVHEILELNFVTQLQEFQAWQMAPDYLVFILTESF